jgi:outer membrane lipoprotein SlyB
MHRITAAIAALSLAACATTGAEWRPVIDTQGVDPVAYESDLRQCQAFSAQTMSAAQGAAAGAVAGALLGAVLAAAVGGSRNQAAAYGATVGGVSAAANAEGGQRGIISRCLSGRGYRVLN